MLRFHPAINYIHDLVKSEKFGKVYSARFEFGSYLPNWHPNENYKDSYWIGYHVFSAFEVNYNSNNFHELIKESYTKSIIDAIPLVSGYNIESFDKIWRLHCNRQKGQLSAIKKQIQ